MVTIQPDAGTPPYHVVAHDAIDANYYADTMSRSEEFVTLDDFGLATRVADALFLVRNFRFGSLEAMNRVDGGWDIRVYDAANRCVHAAHTNFADGPF